MGILIKLIKYIKNFIIFFLNYSKGPRMEVRFIEGPLVIRMQLASACANRPFYRIILINNNMEPTDKAVEDLGSFDPLPNKDNAVVVALNYERIKYHMGRGVMLKGAVRELLGLSGFLPVCPSNYIDAYKNRQKFEELENQKSSEEKSEESNEKTL
jgi:small subunit ribosomal protein S16